MKTSIGAIAPRRSRTAEQPTEDRSVPLIEITVESWSEIPDRSERMVELNTAFHEYLEELYKSANDAIDGCERFTASHARWKKVLIISTGCVAALNLMAAYRWQQTWLSPTLSMLSALAAITLTVLANLESSENCLEKAQAYREAREMFLDAARELDRLWNTHVLPLGDAPEACANASELYRRAVTRDRELRGKLKEMTKTKEKTARK